MARKTTSHMRRRGSDAAEYKKPVKLNFHLCSLGCSVTYCAVRNITVILRKCMRNRIHNWVDCIRPSAGPNPKTGGPYPTECGTVSGITIIESAIYGITVS
jgi:hypothetical protein